MCTRMLTARRMRMTTRMSMVMITTTRTIISMLTTTITATSMAIAMT